MSRKIQYTSVAIISSVSLKPYLFFIRIPNIICISDEASDNLPYEKVGKNEPVCIADEVPFDIPDSWEWVRLGSIGETNIGLTYRPSDKTDVNGTLVLRSSNIQDGNMDYSDCVYVSCAVPDRAMIDAGDILICARNGSRSLVGKCAIVDRNGMAFGAFMAKFCSLFNPYVKVFIDSPVFRKQLDGVKTETINQITQDMLLVYDTGIQVSVRKLSQLRYCILYEFRKPFNFDMVVYDDRKVMFPLIRIEFI